MRNFCFIWSNSSLEIIRQHILRFQNLVFVTKDTKIPATIFFSIQHRIEDAKFFFSFPQFFKQKEALISNTRNV